MGVYKFSEAGTFVEPRTLYKSMLAGNEAFVEPGDYELIATEILTTTESSITFSNLGDYSSTYKHLQIRATARSTRVDTDDLLQVLINGATTGYSQHGLWGTGGGSVNADATASTTSIFIARTTGANAPTGSFTGAVIDFLDPFSTTKNKTLRGLSGTMRTTNPFIDLRSGAYYSTSSTTSVLLRAANGNLLAGSRFSLYGIRG